MHTTRFYIMLKVVSPHAVREEGACGPNMHFAAKSPMHPQHPPPRPRAYGPVPSPACMPNSLGMRSAPWGAVAGASGAPADAIAGGCPRMVMLRPGMRHATVPPRPWQGRKPSSRLRASRNR